MNSLDTSILLYATNADCPEHRKALTFVEDMLRAPGERFFTRNKPDFDSFGWFAVIDPMA